MMGVSSAFAPSMERGQALDALVRQRVAESLQSVFDIGASVLEADPKAVHRLLERVRAAPVSPGLVALYADLVSSLGEEEEVARACASDLLTRGVEARPQGVVPLAEPPLPSGWSERYARLICEGEPDLRIVAPSPEVFARGQGVLTEAQALLTEAAPELAGEIDALVHERVLVAGAPGSDYTFDGASTFYLWGALALNATRLNDRLQGALALTHEAAHSLLLGLTLGEPLVENLEEERFASPLRHDPRPMDGLVHAAYVLARMTYAAEALLASGQLSASERAEAARSAVAFRGQFRDGLGLIEDHARFTPDGAAIFAGAVDWMSQSGPAITA